ncbi:alpha/beta fold hydrolase [Dactylosporangium sp. McL0621]|uniref:alpha/beta fold hydrolase n=1 Tax=Dactylosporangium sp. McL0621 TaxID=3415678 RepID=UPI003CF9DF03
MYTRLHGSGERLLVIVQPGDGDADGTEALVRELAKDRTILTYDRRGLSRSPAGDGPVTIESHTDDLALMLAHKARSARHAQVDVLGISIGALIGLDLAARYPALVRTLVAYEPPLPQLLDDPEPFVAEQRQIEAGGLQRFLAFTGFDPADRERDAVLPRPGPDRARNLEFFLTYDAPAARRFRLYLEPLTRDTVVPAMGRSSRGRLHAAPVEALARLLGTEPVEFEGGHSAHVFRPKAFARTLTEVLDHH